MPGMWRTLREKLGFTKRPSTGCCGNLWCSGSFSPPINPATRENGVEEIGEIAAPESAGEMNLAAALAEEQKIQEAESSFAATAMGRPSLMSWLEEEEQERTLEAVGLGESCCVCMERTKGSAFIPCGHTFCRVCAQELWIERRSCALCNHPILEILDIF